MGGQSAPNLKGKISRVLAARLSLSARVDALGDQTEPTLGREFKEYVEKRLATLEETGMRSLTKGINKPRQGKQEKKPEKSNVYNAEADAVEEAPVKKKKGKDEDVEEAPVEEEAARKKKKKRTASEAPQAEEEEADAPAEPKKK